MSIEGVLMEQAARERLLKLHQYKEYITEEGIE
jgi:hypothetical protein